MKNINRFMLGVIVLAVLTPLGLLLPRYFKSGAAWGEREMPGMFRGWSGIMPGYTFSSHEVVSYAVSALIGVAITAGAAFLLAKLFIRKK